MRRDDASIDVIGYARQHIHFRRLRLRFLTSNDLVECDSERKDVSSLGDLSRADRLSSKESGRREREPASDDQRGGIERKDTAY